MKKRVMITAVIICLVLAGCSPSDTLQNSSLSEPAVNTSPERSSAPALTLASPQPTPSLFEIELTDLPEKYSREDTIANGDYVYTSRGPSIKTK